LSSKTIIINQIFDRINLCRTVWYNSFLCLLCCGNCCQHRKHRST